MTVTSITAEAVSLRTVTQDASRTRTSETAGGARQRLGRAVAAGRGRGSHRRSLRTRAETLMKTFDTDGDGVVTKTEFTAGAIELLKRASLHFLHERVGGAEGADKRDQKRVNLPTV